MAVCRCVPTRNPHRGSPRSLNTSHSRWLKASGLHLKARPGFRHQRTATRNMPKAEKKSRVPPSTPVTPKGGSEVALHPQEELDDAALAALVELLLEIRERIERDGHPRETEVDPQLLDQVIAARPDSSGLELTRAYNRRVRPEAAVSSSALLRAARRYGYLFKKDVRGPRSTTGATSKGGGASTSRGRRRWTRDA